MNRKGTDMRRKRMVGIVCALMIFITGCAGSGGGPVESTGGNKETASNSPTSVDSQESSQSNTEEVTTGAVENTGPIVITYTNKDYISVRIRKDFYNPLITDRGLQVDFLDENHNPSATLLIADGGEYAQCRFSYGDYGDTSKTIVSDWGGFKDEGDSLLFEIFLNNPKVTITGGDNLPVPKDVFDRLAFYMYADKDDAWQTVEATGVVVFDIDDGIEKGAEKISKILYVNDKDREYLTPESDDFRVEIYEIPEAVVYRTASTIRPPGSVLRFGTDPSKDAELVKCKVTRVVEYDKVLGDITAYSERTEFENERDALCVIATNFRNENHPYQFVDQVGVDLCPDDFDPMAGLATICDRLMPNYYNRLCSDMGMRCKMERVGNVYYRKFTQIPSGYAVESHFTSYSELDLLGCTLHTKGNEFSANHCDRFGFSEFTKDYEYELPEKEGTNRYQATVYYSKVDAHKNAITQGNGAVLPDDFVTLEDDAKYFTPATDDFILIYMQFDYEANTDAVLLSFDAKGNPVDAKYRMYKHSNMMNPMQELVGWMLEREGVSLLNQNDPVAYFDILGCNDLRFGNRDGSYGRLLTKQEILEDFIDEHEIYMPCNAWSTSYAMYISQFSKLN